MGQAEGSEMPLERTLGSLQPIAGAVGDGEWVEFHGPVPIEVTDAAHRALFDLARLYGVSNSEAFQPSGFSYRAEGESLGEGRAIHFDVVMLPLADTAIAVFHVRREGDFAVDEGIRLLWLGLDVHVKPGGRYAGVVPTAWPGTTAFWWRAEDANGRAGGQTVLRAVEWERDSGSGPIKGLVLHTDAGADAWSFYAVVTDLSQATYGGELAQAFSAALEGEAPRGILASTQSITPQTVTPGSTVRYTLTLQNIGAAPLTDVSVRLPVPVELDVALESLTVSGGEAGWDAAGRTLSWSVDSIRMGGKMTLTFQAVIR